MVLPRKQGPGAQPLAVVWGCPPSFSLLRCRRQRAENPYLCKAKKRGRAIMQDQRLEGRQEYKHATEQAPTSTMPVREPTPTPADKPRYDYAYYKEVFSGRAMPYAFLDLDLLDQNIRQITARAKGKQV